MEFRKYRDDEKVWVPVLRYGPGDAISFELAAGFDWLGDAQCYTADEAAEVGRKRVVEARARQQNTRPTPTDAPPGPVVTPDDDERTR